MPDRSSERATRPSVAVAGVALSDWSCFARTGLRGGSAAFLARAGLAMPAEPNQASRNDAGILVARLGASEVLVLAPGRREPLDPAYAMDGDPDGDIVPLPRAFGTCWLHLAGGRSAEILSMVCGVDLRPHRFPDLGVAQTVVARVNATIVRDDAGQVPAAFHLIADWTYGPYLWAALADAVTQG